MLLKESILKLMNHQHLDTETCQHIFDDVLIDQTNQLQTMAFLLLLRTKFETADELYGIIAALKKQMIVVKTNHDVLDIVGTGGDGARTINISTGSAILAASCGIKIAKHGNVAVSSLSGSADVLAALGVNINKTAEKVAESIDQIGIGFCFSPLFHPAYHKLSVLRRELNVPTTLNLLGPLLNPTNPAFQLIGVYNEKLLPLFADVLKRTAIKRAMIVHGCGLDEISCVGPIKIIEVTAESSRAYFIDAVQFGFKRCSVDDLRGDDAKTNARLLMDVFAGKKQGAIADSLIFNAAVALYLYGLSSSIKEAIAHAQQKLFDGSALTMLNNWIEHSNG